MNRTMIVAATLVLAAGAAMADDEGEACKQLPTHVEQMECYRKAPAPKRWAPGPKVGTGPLRNWRSSDPGNPMLGDTKLEIACGLALFDPEDAADQASAKKLRGDLMLYQIGFAHGRGLTTTLELMGFMNRVAELCKRDPLKSLPIVMVLAAEDVEAIIRDAFGKTR